MKTESRFDVGWKTANQPTLITLARQYDNDDDVMLTKFLFVQSLFEFFLLGSLIIRFRARGESLL